MILSDPTEPFCQKRGAAEMQPLGTWKKQGLFLEKVIFIIILLLLFHYFCSQASFRFQSNGIC